MKKTSLLLLIIIVVCSSSFVVMKPKKYKGTVISVINTYEGEIKIDLSGPNKEMIEIQNATIVKRGFLNMTANTKSTSVNSMLVKQVIIDGTTYHMANLENGYKEIIENACVTLVMGTDSLGLFQFKDDRDKVHFYVRKTGENSMRNIEHENFTSGSFIYLIGVSRMFQKCKELETKIKKKHEGYLFTEATTPEMRLELWKKLFTEYAACAAN